MSFPKGFQGANIGVLGIGVPGGVGVMGNAGQSGIGVSGIVQTGAGATATVQGQMPGLEAARQLLETVKGDLERTVGEEDIVEVMELVSMAQNEIAEGAPSTWTKLRSYLKSLAKWASDKTASTAWGELLKHLAALGMGSL